MSIKRKCSAYHQQAFDKCLHGIRVLFHAFYNMVEVINLQYLCLSVVSLKGWLLQVAKQLCLHKQGYRAYAHLSRVLSAPTIVHGSSVALQCTACKGEGREHPTQPLPRYHTHCDATTITTVRSKLTPVRHRLVQGRLALAWAGRSSIKVLHCTATELPHTSTCT